MQRRLTLGVWACAFGLAAAIGCGPESDSEPGTRGRTQDGIAASPVAARIVRDAAARFSVPAADSNAGPRLVSALQPGEAISFREDAGWIVPDFADDAASRDRAEVALGAHGRAPFRLEHRASGLSVEVGLEDAGDVEPLVADGYVVYRGALSAELERGGGKGGDVVVRPHAAGVEDYVLLDAAPQQAEIRYRIRLNDKVRGLRLVENVLELVDAGGGPWLRMASPWLQDANGKRHPAQIAVRGCNYDTNPAAPWGRSATDPGARQCSVAVSWSRDSVAYPAILDPAWTTAASMLYVRSFHTANRIRTSAGAELVLVAGGASVAWNDPHYGSSELYNPATNTWAATGAIGTTPAYHAAVTLSEANDAKVLLCGGKPSFLATSNVCRRYTPSTGAWTATAPMATNRAFFTLTRIWDAQPRIVAAGGETTASTGSVTATTELYDPATNTWAASMNLSGARAAHSAVQLDDQPTYGAVFFAGGRGASGSLSSTCLMTRASGTVTMMTTAAMSEVRELFPMVRIPGTATAFAFSAGKAIPAAEIYLLNGNQWSPVPNAPRSHAWALAAALPGSTKILVEGAEVVGTTPTADVFDTVSKTWQQAGAPSAHHGGGTIATLSSGDAVLAGGFVFATNASHKVVDRFKLVALGGTCTLGGECGSGYCVDGVCCNSSCTGLCQACSASKKGQGTNGTCGVVAAGLDPDGNCPDDGAWSCDRNGQCNGAGACQLYASGTQCQTPNCSSGTRTTYACNGSGSCLSAQTSCAPYVCAGTACGTTCAGDVDCTSSTFCNTAVTPKTCDAKRAQGQLCTGSNQCVSGFCANGRCCDSACAGGCDRCDQTGALGTCTILAPGSAPDASCTGSTGYLCSGSSAACPTSCLNDSNCASGYYCGSDSKCKPKKTQGANCNTGVGGDCAVAGCAVCTTGNCVDGVCCNTACAGQCNSCNVAGSLGTCSPSGLGTPGNPSCSPYECGTGSTCATSCTSNANCAAGYFCNTAISQCEAQTGLGASCSTQAQCGAGLWCVDGVCCNSDCVNPCMACSAAKKGQGANGLCDNVVAGQDPDADCPDEGSTTCGKSGACNGSGQCALYATGTSCGVGTSCTSGQQTTYKCNGLGQCLGTDTTLCSPYVCGGATCGSSCADDAACAAGKYCDTATSTCVPQKAPGQSCTLPSQCALGYCVDGLCCDKACTGTCHACTAAKKGSGDDGVCAPILKGGDPDNECAADPVSTCQKNGTCDGAGACDFYSQGAACGSASCVGNSAVGKVCNSFNECKDDATGVPCAPYLCGSSGCPSSCSSASECTGGFYCAGSACTIKKAKGDACATDVECDTGFCADGYCCNTACGGQCEACDTTGGLGTCTPVSGAPHGSRPACSGTGACAGACDGASAAACAYPGSTTLCEGTTCEGNVFKPTVCNAQGLCVAGTSQDCGTYACDSTAGACKTQCTSSSDCASGAQCSTSTGQCAAIGATCKDAFTVVTAGGQEQSCAPYKCVGGACQQQCSSTGDCAPGYDCSGNACVVAGGDAGSDAETDAAGAGGGSGMPAVGGGAGQAGAAGSPSSGGGDEGGCGCSVPRRSGPFSVLAMSGLAALLLARRRRVRRHESAR